jgi:hypothetical protein
MAGTHIGGKSAAQTNTQLHGADFYARIGALGGRRGHTGGFASTVVGADGLTGRERARVSGATGGRISRRTKAKKTVVKRNRGDMGLAA